MRALEPRGPAPLVLALVLAVLVAGPARAQAPAPPQAPGAGPPPLIASVEVGFDKGVVPRVPAPVWVTLENRRERELELRVVVRSKGVAVDQPLVLPAGARKRVCLALVVDEEVLVSLERDGEPLEQRVLRDLASMQPGRHVLVLDGRPPERRTAGHTRRDEQVLQQTTIDAGSAPMEAACYAAFGAVLVREADPGAWSEDQRQALLEHVRDGGLLLLSPAGPKHPEVSAFFDALVGPEVRLKVAGRPARARSVGLGRAVAWDEDLLQAAWAADASAADLRQRVGDLVADGLTARDWPRPADEEELEPFAGPGVVTRSVVVGFLAVYLLAVGPVLAVVLRRASRPQLATATAALVGGFSLLAPVVAGVVRTGGGVARVRTVLYVPPGGGAFEAGDLTVISGGATHYAVDVEGAPVAATVVLATTGGEWGVSPSGRYELLAVRPAALSTHRGEQVSFDVGMPPWGTQRVTLTGPRPDVRPIEGALRRIEGGVVATITNTSGGALRSCLIVEEAAAVSIYTPYVLVGDLTPGQRVEVEVPRPMQVRRPAWFDVLDVPSRWAAWARLAPVRGPSEVTALRYRLVSRARSPLRVSGASLTVEGAALRVDPLVVTAGGARGFLGVAVEDVPRGRRQAGVRVARVVSGSPFDRLGLGEGVFLLSIDGTALTTALQFRSLVGRHVPGEALSIEVFDGVQQRTVQVTLGARGEGE